MGGIARTNSMKALAVGGIADHSHILLSLPPTIAITKAIQLVKAGSSKWMHEQTGSRRFEWQEGYGAFSIGASQVPATIRYIENQPQRHRKISPARRMGDVSQETCAISARRLISAVPDGTWVPNGEAYPAVPAGLFSIAPDGAQKRLPRQFLPAILNRA
jgi:hypothetical protein